MPNAVADASNSPAVPPIVLLVSDNPVVLDQYSATLETSGLCVIRSAAVPDALAAIDELPPDLVVSDFGFDGALPGLAFADGLKSDRGTSGIPLIVLTSNLDEVPRQIRDRVDLWLVRPVATGELLCNVREVIARNSRLRREWHQRQALRPSASDATRGRRSQGPTEPQTTVSRRCPRCGVGLEWIERSRIGGVNYDYFHWCAGGCGLYCFDRDSHRWVKLAG